MPPNLRNSFENRLAPAKIRVFNSRRAQLFNSPRRSPTTLAQKSNRGASYLRESSKHAPSPGTTHTPAPVRTHAHAHARTHTRARAYMRTLAHQRTRTHTASRKPANATARPQTQGHTRKPSHAATAAHSNKKAPATIGRRSNIAVKIASLEIFKGLIYAQVIASQRNTTRNA